MQRQQLMLRAWQIAKDAVDRFDGSPATFFGAALAQAWGELKEVVVRPTTQVTAIQERFVWHKFSATEAAAILAVNTRMDVLAETDQALRIRFHTSVSIIDSWVPKKVLIF